MAMTKTRLFLAFAASLWLAACDRAEEAAPFDILIVNGLVYDGSLQAGQQRNIGIVGGRIASMDALADAPAGEVIDAGGLAVMPGFIDPHTHAEDDLFAAPAVR